LCQLRYNRIRDGAHGQHQAGVQNVLAGESAVDPRRDSRSGSLAQQLDQADDRVAPVFGGECEQLAIGGIHQV
jgi:hypothetical protein